MRQCVLERELCQRNLPALSLGSNGLQRRLRQPEHEREQLWLVREQLSQSLERLRHLLGRGVFDRL
jgi:hypothetical protein